MLLAFPKGRMEYYDRIYDTLSFIPVNVTIVAVSNTD
jgi:hypothetical protein